MNAAANPLTPEILEAFFHAARQAGSALALELAPGLNDEEIDALGRHLGVQVPSDVRTLWKFGVPSPTPSNPGGWNATEAFALLPPAQAVKDTLELRGEELVDDPNDWVAIAASDDGWILVDATDAQRAPVWASWGAVVQAAPDLAGLFASWTDRIVSGDVSYSRGRWWRQEGGRDSVESRTA